MISARARSLGRLELLKWLNSFLESDYSKVDHLGDGVAFLQVLDALFPRRVDLHRVDFHAADEDARIRNLNLVQDTLDKLGLKREIPVRRLAKCRFADNCEMLRYCYDLVHKLYPDANKTYQAESRRLEATMQGRQRKRSSSTGSQDEARAAIEGQTNPNLIPAHSLLPGRQKSPPPPIQIMSSAGEYPPDKKSIDSPGAMRGSNELPEGISPSFAERLDNVLGRGAAAKLSPGIASPSPAPSPPAPLAMPMTEEDLSKAHILTQKILQQRVLEEQLENVRIERDFYFDTLRDIESAVQDRLAGNAELRDTVTAEMLESIIKRQESEFSPRHRSS
eukprot:g3627.t1